MAKQKTVKGLRIEYAGKIIENIISMYIDVYDEGLLVVNYMENEYTTINLRCPLNEAKIITQ